MAKTKTTARITRPEKKFNVLKKKLSNPKYVQFEDKLFTVRYNRVEIKNLNR